MTPTTPYLFDEFFASGREESISPFLTKSSRSWGKNLPLKSAIFSAGLLFCAWISFFFFPSLSYLLLTFVYFFAGTPALISALEDIKNLEINIDVLMTLAALLSVLIGSSLEGALLLVLFELSGAMEKLVSDKTKGTLIELNHLSPKFAYVLTEKGTTFAKAVRDISPGTLLLIKAGEIIPLDGKVKNGASFVNLLHLTGESHPVPKKTGDEVQAGSRNLDGTLTVEVTRTSRDSTLSRIVQLIIQAQEAKPQLQRFLDRFGKWYALSIISLSFLFALFIPFAFHVPFLGTEGGIYRALAFLIAASPCALILATPTAYLSAISSCARRGILIKGGVILDALANCKQVAFDKTGTLTTGKLTFSSMELLSSSAICTEKQAISIAAALESGATHPIAEAILNLATKTQVLPATLSYFKAIPGYGLEGTVELNLGTFPTFIGHPEFISTKISPSFQREWKKISTKIYKEGHSSTLLLISDTLFLFHFLDQLRPESIETIHRLKTQTFLSPIMLTGDHALVAQAIAKKVGIETVHADLRPDDKLKIVAQLSQEEGLIMIGDGVNDAPALARATVGISLGKIGSATAVDASDVVFLNDDLSLLDWLIRKSKETKIVLKQNLTLALSVILLATLPTLVGVIPLWLAVILHEGGSVLVGLNSLRLLRSS